MSPGPCSSFIAYPWSSFLRKTTAGSSMILRSLVFFLLLVQNPCWGAVQPEYSILDRGQSTSFSTASVASAKPMPMQVCITIGCCRHVCRQFTGPASSPVAENCKPAELEPIVEQLPASEQVAVIPEFLEWNPQVLFSPSIKYLTIVNTGNDTMLEVNLPKSTNGQFYSQGSEETTVIAPKGSVTVPVVYLPQHLGEAIAKLIIRTSAGDRVVQVRGQGSQAPYQLQDGEGIQVLEGRRLTISFYNPDKQDIQIDQVESWPEDSHRNAVCFTDRHGTQNRVINCSNSRKREAVSGITVAPGQRMKIFETEVSKKGTWKGSLYVKFSRKSLDEVMILPLELQASKAAAHAEQVIDSVGTLSELQVGLRPGTGVENSALNVQDMAPGKLTQADNTLKPLIKDLGIILVRQAELKPGSLLSTSQNRPTLTSESVLSFSTVQMKSKSQLWVNLVNPSDQSVTVKLQVAPEVKSTNCKYKASWFRQSQQEAKVEKNNGLFGFQEGALIQAVIQPEGKLSVGPVTFHPKARCDWFGLLFVKNSLSGLEWMPLHGRARSAEVSFLDKAQGYRIKKLSLVAPTVSTDTCPTRIINNFSIKNSGDLSLRVHRLHLDGSGGSLKLESPETGFSLPAGQMTDLMISYEPNLEAVAAGTAKATLELVTSIGKVRVPVVATLPKQLVAACRESPLHERLILPLSVSALTVVLGVFSRLLLQELHQPSASKPRAPIKGVGEDRKQRQNGWRKAFNLWKSQRPSQKKLDFQLRQQDKSPLKVKIEPDVDRLKLKKKKKTRTPGSTPDSSAPVSPMSPSASGSPFSASDSEKKTPAIDRILDASRLSRSKTMPNTRTKQDQGTNTNSVPDGHDQSQETSPWNQFPVAAKPKDGPRNQPAKLEEDPWNQLPTPAKPEDRDRNQSSKPEEFSAREAPTNSSSSNKIKTVERATAASDLPASSSRTSRPYTPPLSPIVRAPGSPVVMNNAEEAGVTSGPLTSIGQLRRKAAELCNQHLSDQPAQNRQVLYDIWGDHFAQMSPPPPRLLQPSYSEYPNAIINNGGSLFSQSLPTWSPDVPPPPSIPVPFPSSEDLAKASMPIPSSSSSSSSNTSYLFPGTSPTPAIETYPGLPEPAFDLFSESIYRAAVS